MMSIGIRRIYLSRASGQGKRLSLIAGVDIDSSQFQHGRSMLRRYLELFAKLLRRLRRLEFKQEMRTLKIVDIRLLAISSQQSMGIFLTARKVMHRRIESGFPGQ